jgi:alkyl hydroperoxide reductase subunit AhpF
MAWLSERDQQILTEQFSHLENPVTLVFFTQSLGCETCATTRQILDEVIALSDKLTLEELNLVLDAEKAAEYRVDKVPAIALVGARDTGIRFFGTPSGYEFMSLIDAILLASSGDSGLSEESRALVQSVTTPMQVQVFVTPT